MADLGTVIAMNMRRERSRRKWRQLDLANQLGWPLSRVARVEGGQQRVQLSDVRDLCKAFDLPFIALLTNADPEDLRALQLPTPPSLAAVS